MDGTEGHETKTIALGLVDEHLEHFAAHAAVALGNGASCSITMRIGQDARRSASTDPAAARCDEVEIAAGAGPCIDAMAGGSVVMVDDVRANHRWPDWADASLRAELLSSGAFPGHVSTGTAVSMNVYRPWLGPWSRDDLLRADVYAQEMARVLELCTTVGALEAQRRALQEALAAQAAIDRAVGAVMVTNRCDAAAALAILKSGAGNRNVDLPDVAISVLEGLVVRGSGALGV